MDTNYFNVQGPALGHGDNLEIRTVNICTARLEHEMYNIVH